MTRNLNRVRIGLILLFSLLAALHGAGTFLLWLWTMGLAFGYANRQLLSGMLGAAVTTTNPADFADRTQTYFNPKLLKALQYSLRLAQYGMSEGYKAIGTAIRFYRPRKANTVGINAEAGRTTSLALTKLTTPTSLTEGVAPTTLTEVKVGYVDITMYQQGGLATLTDKLQALDLLNTLQTYSKTMGEDAALDYDTVCRDALLSGVANSNNTYKTGIVDGGYFERFAGVANTGNSANDFATLAGLTKANGKFTRGVALGVVTQLATSKTPKLGGNYVSITPPQMYHDIRQDVTWVAAGTYQDTQNLYKDLEIMLDGVAYVRANNPWQEYNTYLTENITDAGAGLIYSAIFLGADAFGLPNLMNKRAGASQAAPRIVVLDQADKADPLNQKTFIGWKSLFGAGPFIAASRTNEIGDVPRYVVLRTKSTFI